MILVVLAQQQSATSTTIGMMLGIYSGGGLIEAVAASKLRRYFKPKTVIVGRVASAAMTLSSEVIPLASLSAGYLRTTIGPVDSVLVLAR